MGKNGMMKRNDKRGKKREGEEGKEMIKGVGKGEG